MEQLIEQLVALLPGFIAGLLTLAIPAAVSWLRNGRPGGMWGLLWNLLGLLPKLFDKVLPDAVENGRWTNPVRTVKTNVTPKVTEALSTLLQFVRPDDRQGLLDKFGASLICEEEVVDASDQTTE